MTFRYDLIPTPLGDALVVLSEQGIVQCSIADAVDVNVPWLLEGVAHRLPEIPVYEPGVAAPLHALMDRYFDGEPIDFLPHLTLDWRLSEGFPRKALNTIAEIPWGETLSYGEVAILAGHPGAARAVGTACRHTPFSLIVPVHRVVRSSGAIGHYGAHPEHKQFLLDLESGALQIPPRPEARRGDPDE